MAQIFLAGRALDGQTGHEAGRLLLRQLWQQHIGTKMPEISVEAGGKPYFVGENWYFSISHTKRHAFCALCDAPIGIDAEEADRAIDLRLADKILSPHERAQFDAAADPRETLLTFWVLKEAQAKRTGRGLRGYPNRTAFTLPDSRVQRLDGCLVAVVL